MWSYSDVRAFCADRSACCRAPVLVKPRFSAFMGTPLDLVLRRLAVQELVIAGTQYPNCIRATVLHAVCLDYDVTVGTACSAQTEPVVAADIVDLADIGVCCWTTDNYLAITNDELSHPGRLTTRFKKQLWF